MAGLLIFGAGKMGGAMLEGALKAGWSGAAMTVIEPHPSPDLLALAKSHDFVLNPAPEEAGKADLILLAIKPQMLDAASARLQPFTHENSIVVSILAGKTIKDIKARLPCVRKLVRAMPNTPAAIGRGMTGVFATPDLTEADKASVSRLLATTGRVEWLPHEAWIDAVTAVSGSGPAYVFHMVEALAKAAEALGLPADLAMTLARTTVEGAGELLHQNPAIPAAILRQNVTSPGGTTAAALEVLMGQAGLAPLMVAAVAAAKKRAEALSG
jgi:pyrroline-5-carboxylate reductase